MPTMDSMIPSSAPVEPPREEGRQRRRWMALAVVSGVFLLIGFYTVSDPGRLHAHAPLQWADYAGYMICHRLTSHSFSIAGRQMALCARCTGMYLGFLTTVVLLYFSGRGRWSGFPPLRVALVLVALIGVMGVDGINSTLHSLPNAPYLYEPHNVLRFVTGMGTGVTMGVCLMPIFAQVVWKRPVYQVAVGNFRELGSVVAVVACVTLLVLSNQPAIVYVLSLASAVGVVVIFTILYTIIALILLRRDGRSEQWQGFALPLALSFALTIAQIALVSYVRYSLTGTMAGLPGLS